MINNVLLASLVKGQFLTSLLFLTFIVMVLKMPSDDVSRLMFNILSDLENGKLLGYVLALIMGGGWFVTIRWQRRTITHEMKRIAETRDKSQEHHLGGLLESSEREGK